MCASPQLWGDFIPPIESESPTYCWKLKFWKYFLFFAKILQIKIDNFEGRTKQKLSHVVII